MNVLHWDLIKWIWLAWLLIWWLLAFNVKLAVRSESPGAWLARVIPMMLAAVLLTARGLPWPLDVRWLPPSEYSYWLGLAVVVAGLGYSVYARLWLGGNWSARVTLKQDHELIDSGPYRHLRHPIYTGIILGFAGSALAVGELRGLLAVTIIVAEFVRKLRLEERWLQELFGEHYEQYRQRSWALLPWLW